MGFFYDDPKPKSKAVPASQLPKTPTVSKFENTAPAGAPVVTPVFAPPVVPSGGDGIYNRVLEATKLENTPAWKRINGFLQPLLTVLPDPITAFRGAFNQAKTAGLTKEDFLGSFNTMRQALETEKTNFEQFAEMKRQTDVVAKEAQLTQISKDIQDAQAKIQTLIGQQATIQQEVATAHARIDIGKTNFTAAYDRRKAEIDQEEAKYTSLVG